MVHHFFGRQGNELEFCSALLVRYVEIFLMEVQRPPEPLGFQPF